MFDSFRFSAVDGHGSESVGGLRGHKTDCDGHGDSKASEHWGPRQMTVMTETFLREYC